MAHLSSLDTPMACAFEPPASTALSASLPLAIENPWKTPCTHRDARGLSARAGRWQQPALTLPGSPSPRETVDPREVPPPAPLEHLRLRRPPEALRVPAGSATGRLDTGVLT